eukprot:gnl/MRDRNA2_/MRDRNA2_97304_c0_seq1.p1 gnl/MRDRNA2_/MRDRNA2_97304_c0~~gnl/MRDRNA2_/MRDRNA2_97304_c0_seq1.p1  ORF type:complete len:317 (+),score=56.90 gnl/MRDRNA2_/MRDRNA2_97304_c0_seq1:75-953(+)
MAGSSEEAQGAPLGGFECAICFELLCDPLQLQCRHAFCRGCLVAAMNRGRQSAAGSRLRCPLCRTEVPSNYDPMTAPAPLACLMRQVFPQTYAQREAQQAEAAALEAAAAPQRFLLRIGNRHELVTNPETNKNGRTNQHRWTMFVESATPGNSGSCGEWAQRISLVKFELMPFFKQDAYLRSPPFTATRVGWGYFDVKVTVTFKDATTRPLEVDHELCFEDGGASEIHEVLLPRNQLEPNGTAAPVGARRAIRASSLGAHRSTASRGGQRRNAQATMPPGATSAQGGRPMWR